MRKLIFLLSIIMLMHCTSNEDMNLPSPPEPSPTKKRKQDRPDLAIAMEIEMTKNPKLGVPTPSNLIQIRKEMLAGHYNTNSRNEEGVWEERGPNNVGGRSRAIHIDLNDASGNTVWAGSVSGGLWKTTNFLSDDVEWHSQDDFFANLAVSSIAQDPSNPNILYFGTGEGWFNGDAVRGLGIWKSIDGGNQWDQLPSTNNDRFHYVQKLKTDITGNLYATTRNDGLLKSADKGVSWTKILGGGVGGSFSERAADFDIASDGTLYTTMGIFSTDGIYKSTNAGGAWNYLSDPSFNNGLPLDSFERVEMAVSPSDPSILYAVFQKEDDNGCRGIYRSGNAGEDWISLPIPDAVGMDEFTRGQAWYDLIIAVDPQDPNTVFLGGVDLLRSIDGGQSWEQISQWYGGGFPYVHADQHEIIFYNNSSFDGIVANDGGVAKFNIDPNFDVNSYDPYCTPSHFNCCNDFIVNVKLGDIDNSSEEANSSEIEGYSNFTSISTIVEAGSSYNLEVMPNWTWEDSKSGAWIDWNQDGEFSEDENIYSESGFGPYATNFSVPANAHHGDTRLRVRLQFSPDYTASPCDGAYSMGETEDYTIRVLNCFVGNGCNDGDPCTVNDVLDTDCNCTGEEPGEGQVNVCDFMNPPTFELKSTSLNITQFYSCAIHPDAGENVMLAGSQDNGTQLFHEEGLNSTYEVTGGDGGFCHIDQNEPHIQISSYIYNYYWITSSSWNFIDETVNIGEEKGRFINPTDYNSETNTLYGAYAEGFISRIKNVGTWNEFDTIPVTPIEENIASAFKVDPNNEDEVWIGSESTLILLANASTEQYEIKKSIDISELTFFGYLRCIDIKPGNSDHILLTFSNYGVENIWQSKNGGVTWENTDGNLPDMPVRWITHHPSFLNGAIIATEMGVWETQSLDGEDTEWLSMNLGLGNVKCSMLKYRASDNTLIVATYGRGLYSTTLCPQFERTENLTICEGDEIIIGDQILTETGTYSIYEQGESEACHDSVLVNVNLTVVEGLTVDAIDTIFLEATEVQVISAPNGFAEYIWSNGETGQFVTLFAEDFGVGEHQFILTVANENGCGASDEIIIVVQPPSSTEEVKIVSLSIFPNPAIDVINLSEELRQLRIFTVKGDRVKFLNRQTKQVDVTDLPTGIYIIRGTKEDQQYIGKFVKI